MKTDPILQALPADADLSRRAFIARLGGGLFVWAVLGAPLRSATSEAAHLLKFKPKPPGSFNAYLHIGADGRVTGYTGKIEMGQGPITSLPQMLAEELDVDVSQVRMVMGDTDLCPFDEGTWGSMTTRFFGPLLRKAAAEARSVLLEMASERLKVPVSQLAVANGVITDTADDRRRVTYGELTQGKAVERRVTVQPSLKEVASYRVVGKPLLRVDSLEKVTGRARYAADIRLPNMLYARVLRPPAHGAVLSAADTSAAKAVEGAVVVELEGLLAVLHENPEVAEEALGKIKATFSDSPSRLDDTTIHAYLAKADVPPQTVDQGGDLQKARTRAVTLLRQTYTGSYVAHAPMEPHAALAHVEGDRASVWASTQNPFGARDEIAEALGLPIEHVRVITPFLGGGFGGKSFNLQAVEASRLSQATKRPVQVMWTREEEFFNDTFRPASLVTIESGLDAQGRIAFWDYEVRFAGDRASERLYDIADHRTVAIGGFQGPAGVHPFGVGAWRAPGSSDNAFARESHVDQLCTLAHDDPVSFRLRQIKDPRLARVLRTAADAWGWTSAKGPSGRGIGVACGKDADTYVAAMAQIEVKDARIVIKRLLWVQDMGLVINPQGARIQMEGGITMGLGYALSEQVRFKNGEIHDTNFDKYTLPRFSWLPKIETLIVKADDQPAGGGGEPAIILCGAVLGNAFHDATGVRLTAMPMNEARIRAALASKA